jgi:RNA polymerase sigma factor (sigma-70 family)
MKSPEFQSFFRALQQGDRAAIEQLVYRCGPHLRRLIRGWLAQSDLQRLHGSSDIWQEIILKFDQSVRSGQAHPENFAQLENYLRTLAYHKFIDLLRRERFALRNGQPAGADVELDLVPDDAPSPCDQVALEELRQRFVSGLSEAGGRVYARLLRGWTWDQIAAELQESPSTVRIRFARETQRIVKSLRLE